MSTRKSKIVHYIFRDIFVSGYINFMTNVMDDYDHIFIMKNISRVFKHGIKSNKADDIKTDESSRIIFIEEDKDIFENMLVHDCFYEADCIIISGLFFDLRYLHEYDDQIWNKVYLHFWGGDFYCYREENLKNASYEKKAQKELLIRSISRCAAILNVVENDYEQLSTILGINKIHFEAPMPEQDSIKLLMDKCLDASKGNNLRILVGNSASSDNCHLEVFEMLSWVKNENIDIFCPLSYGELQYREEVIRRGTEIFGSKIHFLTEFIPLERYIEFLNTCDIGIFNNNRQQGFKNITTLLCLGKKVFIREDTAIHKRLLNLGVEISTLNDIRTNNLTIFKKLPIDVQLKNRKVISSFFESYQASWEYVFNKKSQKTFISRKNKPISLSIHLTDHCNLNCKGCSHFAPIANEYYISKLELESTLQLLNDADECIISELVLMGGEPLLHPKLGEILSLCRHYLKDIPLKIVTNGLIVQSISDDIWELCKQFDISVEITCYPIEVNYMDLISYLKNKKVKVNVYVDRRNGEFRKDVLNPKANYNNSLNYAKCRIGGLYPQIKNNKIFRCATAANIHILNSTFGTEFKYDEFDYLPLEDIKSMDEIRDFLMHPAPFCKYCNISQQRKEKWEISSKNKDEWLEID